MWIVNFEGIVADWEMAQRRVALGERATLTGAGNRMGGKSSARCYLELNIAHDTRRSSRSNPLEEVLIPSQNEHRESGYEPCIRKHRDSLNERAHSLSTITLPLGGFTDAFRFE